VKARSDELQIFVSVIECGSISAAAEQVGQTPSAVSRTLSRLEAKLDTTLINRTTRRMDLTEEGKYFFEQAKLILAQMDELEERLSSRQKNPAGRLRINAAVPFMLHGIVPYIAEFRSLYPDIQLELNSDDLIIDLLEQSTDIAIRIGVLADSTLHWRITRCSASPRPKPSTTGRCVMWKATAGGSNRALPRPAVKPCASWRWKGRVFAACRTS
jgi:DNA-binding transcriptional LysR family regulator